MTDASRVSLSLRIPADLKNRLDAAAQENGTSTNAEITARLERCFESSTSNKLARLIQQTIGAIEYAYEHPIDEDADAFAVARAAILELAREIKDPAGGSLNEVEIEIRAQNAAKLTLTHDLADFLSQPKGQWGVQLALQLCIKNGVPFAKDLEQ